MLLRHLSVKVDIGRRKCVPTAVELQLAPIVMELTNSGFWHEP